MIGRWLLQTVSAHHFRWIAALGASLLLTAALLVVASPLRASTPLGALLPATPLDHAPATSPPPFGQGEGIQVHGEWLIEVFNPDGTLANQRAFKNALTTWSGGGADTLARVLARSKSFGLWQVHVNYSPGGGNDVPCHDVASQVIGTGCLLLEPAYPVGGSGSGPEYFKTLTVSSPPSGQDAGKLVLKGSATAARTGKINHVSTVNAPCPPASAPSQPCLAAPEASITVKNLSPAYIDVVEGQIIDVTVVISFS